MSEDRRNRVLGVKIQQIFVCEVKSSPDAAEAYASLQSINFDLELRGMLQAAGRAAAFCVLVLLFMLTIHTLW